MTGPVLRRRPPLLSRLILAAGVILALFVVAELMARWLGPSSVVVGPGLTEHDPVYGKQLKPAFTARRTTPETSFVVRTNSLGFRDPEPAGPLTGAIVFLGDSHTLGYGVENEETYPALARARLHQAGVRGVPVVNAGLHRSGIGWWLPFLERRAGDFAPRAVVLQVSPDHFGGGGSDPLFALRNDSLQPREVPGRSWRQRMWSAVDAVPGLGYSHLLSVLRLRRTPDEDHTAADRAARPADHRLARVLLAEAVDRARSRGWPVIGLLVGLEAGALDAAVEVFDAWSVPWVRVPSAREAPELYFRDGHLRAAGHRVAAERVWGALQTVVETPPAGP